MRKLFFLTGCLLALSSIPALAQTSVPALAQASKPDVVVVRVAERENLIRVSIARGTAAPETLEFENGGSEKTNAAVAAAYQRIIAQLYEQGYVLQSTLSATGNVLMGAFAGTTSTLIFVKAPKP